MQPAKIILPILLLPVTASLLGTLPLRADDDPCRSLTDMYCTRCHNIERICDTLIAEACTRLGKKDEAAWQATIKVMGEYGDIDQATQDQVLTCVSKMEKGESAVCKK